MASRVGSITEDKILQLNEAAVPKNNKKVYPKTIIHLSIIIVFSFLNC